MIPDFAKDMIANWRLGHIATADQEGRPNLSPKGTFVVHDDATIGFAAIRSPDTLANIAVRPEVEVSFVDILTRRSVLLKGQARIVTQDASDFPALSRPYRKLWPDLTLHATAIVVISVTSCRPTCSPAYDVGAESDELRAQWMRQINNINIQHKSAEVTHAD
ncbi:hypothetical protein SAMN04488030_1707 [Aliiroseovarius halocynthiae]|nr:pyridoxamine 5'-phosphate oxidase family protein [Aliiroseovarius halocynthiae]SMR72958.1 hypothetical protein SAMN04488030_1707 [Aliiroseovarius halocynthiae]